MPTKLDAAARKARIRAALNDAQERPGRVEAATEAHTEPVREAPRQEIETPSAPEPTGDGYGPTTLGGGHVGLPRAATSQRSSKPPNYKLHVLTALLLAGGIRILKYGTKAITG